MEVLRSTLQPITHNLPEPVRDLAISLLGPACYQSLALDVNLHDADCLRLAVSKGLGVGIIAASSVVKVPQIIKLLSSRSGAGVSALSLILETVAYLVGLAYNVRSGFPFSTFGETALILTQNVIITALVLHYTGRSTAASLFVALLGGGASLLFGEKLVDMQTLGYLQAGAGVLGVASKLPQIWAIWQEGGTGQLSAFAVFNYLAGSLSRIFTTLQEVDDKLILYGFVAGFVLNAVLALQMVYYWNSSSSSSASKKKSKNKSKSAKKTATNNTSALEPSTPTPASAFPSASAEKSGGSGRKAPSTRRRG